jgi:hypothetical protein
MMATTIMISTSVKPDLVLRGMFIRYNLVANVYRVIAA